MRRNHFLAIIYFPLWEGLPVFPGIMIPLVRNVYMIHDSINRESFMPGVMVAVKRVSESDELVVGLASVLGLDKLNT